MIKGFLEKHTLSELEKRLASIRTSSKFIGSHKFPLYQEYTNEYFSAFHKYL